MKIETSQGTDVGQVREHNEDYLLVDERLGLFVVCDGMGGHAAGEVAAELTAKTVQETLEHVASEPPDTELSEEETVRIVTIMRNSLENANARVHRLGDQDPRKRGAGTTCTALLIRGGRGFLAHVGDSRAYLSRYGAVHQLSTDHTAISEAIRQGMSEEDARATFGSNMLTRAIGPNENVVVDSLVFHVLPGDTYMLCSDGMHGYLETQEELVAMMEGNLEHMPARLIELANERGGDDNITAVSVRLASEEGLTAEQALHERIREDLAALSHMPLFAEMSYQELLEIAGVVESQTYQDGDVVLKQGEQSDSLHVIARGAVAVERENKEVASLEPGCHFGEIALLTSRPRSATVRAVGDTRLLSFSRSNILGLFERRTVIGIKFLWTLAQIQSLRLDEALLWQTAAEQKRPPEDHLAAPTQRMYSTPFSRR